MQVFISYTLHIGGLGHILCHGALRKFRWIKVVELKNANNNTKCDCKDRFIVLENNLINSIENSNSMLDSIKDNIFDIEGVMNDKEDFRKDKEDVINKFYLIENKIKEFKKECENLLIDISMTKEFSYDNTYHTIEECKSNDSLDKHSKSVSNLCKTLDKLSEELKQIKEDKKNLFKKIEDFKKEEERKEEKQLSQEVMTGAAAFIQPNKEQETIKGVPVTSEEKMYYNLANNFGKISPVANACLQDALHDFKMAKENPNAVILNSRDEIKNKDINKVLIDYKVPKNSRGVYYNINSEESKKIAKSHEIQKFIDENYDDLQNSNCKKDSLLAFNENIDQDLYLAFQHFRLLNPKITPDGYFEATVIDYYDFNYRNIEKGDSLNKTAAKNLNNWGYSMQEKGALENYYVIFSIKLKL